MKNRSILRYIGFSLIFFSLVLVLPACLTLQKEALSLEEHSDPAETQESLIITETNNVRTNPGGYAAILEAELPAITDPAVKAEYNAAITALKATPARSPLAFEQGLSFAARDHAADMVKNNFFSHTGSDGSSVDQRISRYGTWSITCGENVSAGRSTAASVVKGWVLSTGHRNNILSSSYTKMGAAHVSGHPTYNWIGVQVFAGGFTPK